MTKAGADKALLIVLREKVLWARSGCGSWRRQGVPIPTCSTKRQGGPPFGGDLPSFRLDRDVLNEDAEIRFPPGVLEPTLRDGAADRLRGNGVRDACPAVAH